METGGSKGASTLGTQCALNAHSIHIDRVRTRNVKVPNRIECALSQSTSVCVSNPVTSGLEWNVGGRSLRHMTSVHRHSRMTSVRVCSCDLAETKALLGILEGRGDADVQNQLDGIIRNKAIYQKVANAMAERGYSRTQGSVDLVATNLRLL